MSSVLSKAISESAQCADVLSSLTGGGHSEANVSQANVSGRYAHRHDSRND